MTISRSSAAASTSTRRAGLRRRIAAIATSAAILAGAFVGAAAPVQAATGYGTISACFQSSFTMYNTTYWGKYTGTAYVDAWYNNQWNQVSTVGLSLTSGCASISVSSGYQWRMRVNEYRKPYRYSGVSQYISPVITNGASWNLGTARLGSFYAG